MTSWLLYEPCCSPQTLPIPTTPANLSAYNLQRTLSIAPTPSSFILSACLPVDKMPLTTLFLFPTFSSIS